MGPSVLCPRLRSSVGYRDVGGVGRRLRDIPGWGAMVAVGWGALCPGGWGRRGGGAHRWGGRGDGSSGIGEGGGIEPDGFRGAPIGVGCGAQCPWIGDGGVGGVGWGLWGGE